MSVIKTYFYGCVLYYCRFYLCLCKLAFASCSAQSHPVPPSFEHQAVVIFILSLRPLLSPALCPCSTSSFVIIFNVIYNPAARFLTNNTCFVITSLALGHFRIHFKLLFVFKAINRLAPPKQPSSQKSQFKQCCCFFNLFIWLLPL
uniref:Uncharacterized protein n=1 Tax=Takifugu rubripes TaxID=31033 RepID=A0A674PF81_TAKRU